MIFHDERDRAAGKLVPYLCRVRRFEVERREREVVRVAGNLLLPRTRVGHDDQRQNEGESTTASDKTLHWPSSSSSAIRARTRSSMTAIMSWFSGGTCDCCASICASC